MNQPPPHRLEPGSIVEGRYRVSRRQGYAGGVAQYTATHLIVGRNVQLEVLTREESKAKRRFRRGGRLLGLMDHPHIVTLHDMGLYEGEYPYMALEYLEGPTLQDRSERTGPMDPREVQRIGLQLLGALAYVHERNIIHRSVGTTNVHLASQWDGTEVAKLTGFSLSRDLGAPPSSSFSSPDAEALSEFAHVAPEQIMAPESVDHRTDLYALGVSLYTLLAGVSPFPQTTISELGDAIIHQKPAPLMTHATVPAALEEIVQQALAKRPEERFVDARAFSNALRQALP